jgi:hypothetical protein
VFRSEPKESVSFGQLSVSVAGCQQERVRLSVVSHSCSYSWSHSYSWSWSSSGSGRRAVYEDEGAMSSESEWLSSRRDGAIVAWHEVPGTARPKEPSRRVRSEGDFILAVDGTDSPRRATDSMIGVDEISNTISSSNSNITGHQLFKLCPVIPYPTGRFSRWTPSQALRARLLSCCPSGTKYILRAEALIKLALMG